MIEKLTTTNITQACNGTQLDGTPCTNKNTIKTSTLYLGQSFTSPVTIDCGMDSFLLVYAKATGKSIEIINPGVVSTLLASEVAGVVTITLAHDGTSTTSTIAEVVTKIQSTATVKDSLYVLKLGDGTRKCAALSKVDLVYSGTASNKNLIKLPVCPNCNSVESLSRTWDRISSRFYGTFQDKHRRAVNFLGKKLKEASQINPFSQVAVSAEASDPPDILADYPPPPGDIYP